jgi:hypothetical protein
MRGQSARLAVGGEERVPRGATGGPVSEAAVAAAEVASGITARISLRTSVTSAPASSPLNSEQRLGDQAPGEGRREAAEQGAAHGRGRSRAGSCPRSAPARRRDQRRGLAGWQRRCPRRRMRCGGYPGWSPARAGCRPGLTASGTSPARVFRCRPEFASRNLRPYAAMTPPMAAPLPVLWAPTLSCLSLPSESRARMPMASPSAIPESFNDTAAESAATSSGKTASTSCRSAIGRSLLLGVEAREAPDRTIPAGPRACITPLV